MNVRHTLLPDVINEVPSKTVLPLQWVGMERISIPFLIEITEEHSIPVTDYVDCFVSLDKKYTKGIHMSRLYLALNQCLANQVVTAEKLNALLKEMIMSQYEYSHCAKIKVKFDVPILKKSLISKEEGFQAYPVTLTGEMIDQCSNFCLGITIPYSSTCPCSASLARQSLSDSIVEEFTDAVVNKAQLLKWISSNKSSIATPHSQRSYVYLKIALSQHVFPKLRDLIKQLETCLGTPVQTAVKRQDEQAFAELNGENLMFCEDAARRVKAVLEDLTYVEDYWYKIEHQESLHAHNAVVIDCKYPES